MHAQIYKLYHIQQQQAASIIRFTRSTAQNGPSITAQRQRTSWQSTARYPAINAKLPTSWQSTAQRPAINANLPTSWQSTAQCPAINAKLLTSW